jgi:hypothetical protein
MVTRLILLGVPQPVNAARKGLPFNRTIPIVAS